MGLDMFIQKKVKTDTIENMLDKLSGEDSEVEVSYWRKFYDLQEAIGTIIGEDIENVTYYKLRKEDITEIIKWLDSYKPDVFNKTGYNIKTEMELLNKLIEETDFSQNELFYYAWW